MNIYAKTVTAIIAAAVVIIAIGLASGAFFLTRHMRGTIGGDLLLAVDIAERYVDAEIRLLKIEAAEAAGKIAALRQNGELHGVLERVLAEHPLFIGLTLLDQDGRADSWGEPPPPDLAARLGTDGKSAVSSTMYGPEGALLMYVSAPLEGGGLLAAALPSMYFSDLLAGFRIYQTGHLFIDDAQGNVIANIRPAWVRERVNFIELAKTDEKYSDLADMISRGISGERGVAGFTVNGAPRICAFRPLSGQTEKWFIGVVAPLMESPIREIPKGMFMIGLTSLALSLLAAIAAGRLVRRPYAEMERLREDATAANNAKSAFLAQMSHEIRTPLNAVVGLGELMLDDKSLSRKHVENMEKIHVAGSTILSLVNDILDISKIESGKFELCPIRYDLPSLINDIATMNTVRTEEKPIEFRLLVDEELPCFLHGDDLRIKQIFNNLLSNAFKYTQTGSVEWRIGFEPDADANSVWLVSSVRDSGIGIRPEDMDKLFTVYGQADARMNRQVEGAGLGLAIAGSLAEMMGGGISVESEYGRGSLFRVRLSQGREDCEAIGREIANRLMRVRHAPMRRDRARISRMDLSYAHVLVVDDIVTNIDVVKGMLKPYGLKVDSATSGPQAVEMIRERKTLYNAVFMDHMMPGMDGVEATRIIRENVDTDYARNVPIIALTANAIAGNEDMFLSKGFQGFISKPIETVRLDAVLRQWVREVKPDGLS